MAKVPEKEFEDMIYQIDLERDIARTQAQIYEQAALDGCDMADFSHRYLNSHFCLNRMETRYSSFQREDARTCLEFIYPEISYPEIDIKADNSDQLVFNPDIAYWIGYTYYQLYCETKVRGKEIETKIPFEKMVYHYDAHHTLDEIYSTDDLCRYYGLEKDALHISYGQYLDSLSE